ncbi:MAG: hypothetical protein ABFD50_05430 [Smithella sp.]
MEGTAWSAPQGILTAAGLTPATSGSTGQPTVYEDINGAIHVVGRVHQEGHLLDLKNDGATGWTSEDITNKARITDPNFPAATYSPFVYRDTNGQFLVFRAVGGDLWKLTMTSPGQYQSGNLMLATSAVPCIGHPSAFVLNDIFHIIYRGKNKLIYEIRLDGLTWKTRSICTEQAAADPVASANATTGLVIFRTVGGVIQCARYNGTAWNCGPVIPASS